ncbi:XAC2610-related protein [Niabella beijingensis]|uniref:XAC2610-related protein n=1 Tax=Niabella beijingensis TaxID=2872700 RepID=UPI001CBB3CE5|nr:hypothetical protein [Niabella beijingensis]MBZ4187311.1 hypothetical protein [Niabella beijingensis]
MKKELSTLLLILLFSAAHGQKTVVYTWLNYSGTIGTYPVELKIRQTKSADSLWGQYYYTRKGSTALIYLEGRSDAAGASLTESAYNPQLQQHETTGSFQLNAIGGEMLTGSWTGTNGNTLPVQLKRTENESANDFQKWDFRLHLYKGEEENAGGNRQTYTKANQLIIYDPEKKSTRELGGFDEAMYDDYGTIELEDLDFDGYPDLKIPVYYPQAIKNDGAYLYFIYHPQTRQFVSDKDLDELGYLDFNSKTKEIRKSDADGRGNEGDAFYRWVGKKFYLIREVRVYEDSQYTFYTEYAIRNGKSVKIKTYQK